MNKNKIWKIVCGTLFGLQLLAQVLSLVMILRLNILPGVYTALVITAYILGLLTTGLLMFLPVKKPAGGKVRRIIACVLAVIIILLCLFAYSAVDKLYNTMNTITGDQSITVTRHVYVLNDDPAQTIQDAAEYTFGIVENYDTECTQLAIAAIEEALGCTISTKEYPTVHEMVDALYSGECGAIILNSGYVAILENDETYADFSDRTRILYSAEIETVVSSQTNSNNQGGIDSLDGVSANRPIDVTDTPFIMYISGSDSRSHYLTTSLSDVNILAVVNPSTHQVLLVNTPRDYYVPNPAGNGQLDKLTHCGVYGVNNSIQTLNDLYDIEIDYYSRINFTGFETLVDAIGGVTVYADAGFTSRGVTILKGENHLNGKQALVFARERYQLAGGDNARGKNQMKLIKAMIGKLTTGTTIISNYSQILDSLTGLFSTSMEMSEISKLVKLQISEMPAWNVQTFAVTGQNAQEVTYSMPGQKLSVMYQNEAYISHARDLVARVMAGEILTEADMQLPA